MNHFLWLFSLAGFLVLLRCAYLDDLAWFERER